MPIAYTSWIVSQLDCITTIALTLLLFLQPFYPLYVNLYKVQRIFDDFCAI